MAEFPPTSNSPESIGLLDIIKAYKNGTGAEFPTRLTNINALLSDNIEPLFSNIGGSPYSNEELGEILTFLVRETLLNKNEIIYTKHLVALLTFELAEQGIELESKELQENLETYLKLK